MIEKVLVAILCADFDGLSQAPNNTWQDQYPFNHTMQIAEEWVATMVAVSRGHTVWYRHDGVEMVEGRLYLKGYGDETC